MAGLVCAFLHLMDDFEHIVLRDRGRTVACAAYKAGDLVGVLNQVPAFIVHDHLHQHIAREEATLGGFALTIFHLHHFFGRDQNTAKFGLHACAVDALDDIALHSFFHAGIGMHHIPTHIGMRRSRGDQSVFQ